MLDQFGTERHRHMWTANPNHRSLEVSETVFTDHRCYLGSRPRKTGVLPADDGMTRPAYRLTDRLGIHR